MNKYRMKINYKEVEMLSKNFDFSISHGKNNMDCYEPSLEESEDKVFYATLLTKLDPPQALEGLRKRSTYFSLVFGSTWVVVPKTGIEVQFEEGGPYEMVENPYYYE